MSSAAQQSHPVPDAHVTYHADEYRRSLFPTEVDARPTIYVVDDDDSMLLGIASLLAAAGYQVETFHSALEFLALPFRRPGCAVLDVLMPELTGAELQRRLVLSDDPLPIVFISGCNDIPMAVEMMKAGALDFLRKPIAGDDLLDAVERAVALDRSRQASRAERERLHERLARLTLREKEVLQEVVQGLLNKQVGARLGITERTVKRHRGMVMHKLGVGSVAELVRFADRVVADGALAAHLAHDSLTTDRAVTERIVHDGTVADRVKDRVSDRVSDRIGYDRVGAPRLAVDRSFSDRSLAERSHRA